MPMRNSRRRKPFLLAALVAVAATAGVVVWRVSVSEAQPVDGQSNAPAEVLVGPVTPPSVAVRPLVRPAAAMLVAAEVVKMPSLPATVPAAVTVPVTARVTAETMTAATLPTTAASTAPATAPIVVSSAAAAVILADAQRMLSTGNLVSARDILNPAITNGQISADDQRALMKLQAEINQTLVFSSRRLPGDTWIEAYTVQYGDVLQKITPNYSLTPAFVQRINNVPDARKLRAGHTIKLVKGPFHAIVTKSTFIMDVYLGAAGGEASLYVCSYPVGLGQDDSTPVGTWMVAPGRKSMNPTYYDPRGGGIIEAEDPKNPLGKRWIGLAGVEGDAVGKTSYGIHGTIEPDSIGKMASLGCVRLRNEDVAVVFEMLVEGKSTVIVKP